MLRKTRAYLILMTVMTFLLFSTSCSLLTDSKEVINPTKTIPKSIFSDSSFAKNRKKLIEKISENSILILFSERDGNATAIEGTDNSPNRNLYYITGINQQSSILMIVKTKGNLTEYIFTSVKDDGKNYTEIEKASGIGNIQELENFDKEFKSIANNTQMNTLYLDLGLNGKFLPSNLEKFSAAASKDYPKLQQKSIFSDIAAMRMTKDNEEINNIRKAIEVTNEGILSMMKNSKEYVSEENLEKHFDTALNKNGISSKGFDSIIGSGKNGLELHYSSNNCSVPKDGLVLVDVGAEYKYYSADISRTFPANGKFTERQKQIYNIVLKTQEEVIKAIKPGVTTKELQALCIKVFTEECIKIGLMHPTTDIRDYYMHGVSHHLGLDVHDATVPQTQLQPGMILTVEPGLYISEENIGIRIEDDVLVTENGCEVLSKDIIKTIEDIENFMKK